MACKNGSEIKFPARLNFYTPLAFNGQEKKSNLYYGYWFVYDAETSA